MNATRHEDVTLLLRIFIYINLIGKSFNIIAVSGVNLDT